MKLVLLSGGSGQRLWPLSNQARSKQFLKVLQNPQGDLESMVQRVWRQLEHVGLSNQSVIATSKTQVDMIRNQIGQDVSIVVEPERRDTFPAIALAASYFYSEQNVDLDEVVGVLPVDPYVEDTFFEKVSQLEDIVQHSGANLALIGVEPTFPSSKYGYIVPYSSEPDKGYRLVSHFQEKPSEEAAAKLLQDRALWNCGVFAFKLGYLIDLIKSLKLPFDYPTLLKQYGQLTKISFDYQVVEKTENIVVLPYDGYWKDLGTWNTLTEEMGTSQLGLGAISKDSENAHLINELDIPVTILGVSNVVVAVSPDGILVSDKDASPRLKEMLHFDQRPMYEERHWGWYRVLDYTRFDQKEEVLTRRIGITAGRNLSYQLHNIRREVWTIIRGEGEFVLNHQHRYVKAGDVLEIPVKTMHALKAITDLELIEVQSGEELMELDVIEIYNDWVDIEQYCLVSST
ncbi:mannose-1-phosphate guanylyltransferase [Paenibacillus alkaliterrae]|uniref:sugar phosphate nucleotidyltransferase n=1 Tax=Paenibacillus alkaliterrae TaxID=320909 RepID=UPI001F2E4625|nr:sugar phosphate nucleotidyltransferase [Paenibacillus alkaliterrae]MCF2939767.1 mannose-1-phosphate guanylyltransferase [Paenibacillus alkaliterrae]